MQQLDVGDLADVDARDAHERVGLDVVGRLEHRRHRVVVAERDGLREAEVRRGDRQQDGDDADLEEAQAGLARASHGVGTCAPVPPGCASKVSPGGTWSGPVPPWPLPLMSKRLYCGPLTSRAWSGSSTRCL